MQLVSIIMPAYNATLYIEDSIKSVIDQTYSNWELLIINDGSTDGTLNMIHKYSLLNSRILIFSQENKGLAAARNKGIRNANGDWIAFLDSDDLWDRTKLERQLVVSEKYPDVDVVFTNGSIFFNNDLSTLHKYNTRAGRFTGKEMYKIEMSTNILPVLSLIVKRKMVLQIGLQDEDYRYCEDWDYWLRMARAGATFIGLDEKLFYYRKHENNLSANALEMEMAEVRVLLKNIDPCLITTNEAFNLLEGKISKLIFHLVRINKIKEAVDILKRSKKAFPYTSYILSYNLLRLFKSKSIKILKILL